MKKMAALIKTEECDAETDNTSNVSECNVFPENKTITLIKMVKDCKPFIGVSILFLCLSIILTGIMTYFYLKSKNRCFASLKKNLFFFFLILMYNIK